MQETPSGTGEQARQAERLALLATLARPVQHEINNLLTVVFANIDMIRRRVTDETPQRQLGRVQEAARRFEASTRAILSLARRPVPGNVVLSPVKAVRAVEPLLAMLLPAPGALAIDAPPEAADCRFDQALLDGGLIGIARAVAGNGTLGITIASGAGAVSLEISLPQQVHAAEATAALLRLAQESGGTCTLAPGRITLILPVAPAAVAEGGIHAA